MITEASAYRDNGTAQQCALCGAPFLIENGQMRCWRGRDQRYYCCPEHARFGLELSLAAGGLTWRKVA
jgi:hypothetical protein